MSAKEFFEGEIKAETYQSGPLQVKKTGEQTLLSYALSAQVDHNLGEQLFHRFQQLNLTDKERQKLSREERKKIMAIQTLDLKTLLERSRDLSYRLKDLASFSILVKAEGYGSFICLAAALKNDLPRNKDIQFDLRGAPIALLPKKLTRHAKQIHSGISISITNRESWLKSFPSLSVCPGQAIEKALVSRCFVPQKNLWAA